MNGQGKPWSLKHRLLDLTHVLHLPVEIAAHTDRIGGPYLVTFRVRLGAVSDRLRQSEYSVDLCRERPTPVFSLLL